jgi:hypothetical protein
MSVGLPKVDDLALAYLIQTGQPLPGRNPLNHRDQPANLLPAVRLAAVSDVAVRQAAHLISQGKCW